MLIRVLIEEQVSDQLSPPRNNYTYYIAKFAFPEKHVFSKELNSLKLNRFDETWLSVVALRVLWKIVLNFIDVAYVGLKWFLNQLQYLICGQIAFDHRNSP